MSVTEFKEKVMLLLNCCIDETVRVSIEDCLDDEDKVRVDSYCEGIKDSIEKINSIPVERISGKTLVVFQDLSGRHTTEVAWIEAKENEEMESKIRKYASGLEKDRLGSKFIGLPIKYEIPTF